MHTKYQVFLSSTYIDLKDARRIVTQQILNMGHIPVGMELFQANNATQWEYIKRRIRSSDFFVVLVAGRYGSTDKDGKSFTEKEFEYARECGVPIMAFPLSEEGLEKLPPKFFEKNEKLENFRAVLRDNRTHREWTEPWELAASVSTALIEQIETADPPRPGWVRSDSIMFKSLKADDENASFASSHLMQAVDRDLDQAGYYRRNQVLDIQVAAVNGKVLISLTFTSEIIPIRTGVSIPRPKVELDEDLKRRGVSNLARNEYYIYGKLFNDKSPSPEELSGVTDDKLCVTYEMDYSTFSEIKDKNLWTSPVTNYSVLFTKSDLCDIKISRVLGKDSVGVRTKEHGDRLIFTDERGGLTAQGFEWSLSRVNP